MHASCGIASLCAFQFNEGQGARLHRVEAVFLWNKTIMINGVFFYPRCRQFLGREAFRMVSLFCCQRSSAE